MQFSDYERVIYERNPLNEVLCQLRFPAILKITSQQPVEFQEKIRNYYPNLGINRPVNLPIPTITSELSNVLESLNQILVSETSYTFTSEDSQWQVSLSKDFIGLSTKSYKRYEEFQDRLKYVLEVFEEIYQPASYIRIGLKYQDLILPSRLGVEPDWKLLIKQHLIPELYAEEIADSVKSMQKVIALEFEDGKANLNHGIFYINDPEQEIVNEQAYFIDTDFFTDQRIVGTENVYKYLAKFNKQAGKLFRWSITEELHQLLNPHSA
jgi:uncharacterized protein (TIGR04255 family)